MLAEPSAGRQVLFADRAGVTRPPCQGVEVAGGRPVIPRKEPFEADSLPVRSGRCEVRAKKALALSGLSKTISKCGAKPVRTPQKAVKVSGVSGRGASLGPASADPRVGSVTGPTDVRAVKPAPLRFVASPEGPRKRPQRCPGCPGGQRDRLERRERVP